MRRLKIGIRPQLIILVGFSSLFSLLILALSTGVYYSTNLSDLRAERLEVISQLKTSQIEQAVDYLFYQVYWLSNKDQLYAPLSSYKAGNFSLDIFALAQSSIDQFLSSSELFSAARLYNLDLRVVAEGNNEDYMVSDETQDHLYPLRTNSTIPPALLQSSTASSSTRYITGPMSNSSDANSTYFIGITVPVYANSSIIMNQPSIAGFLTVLAKAQNIQAAVNDTPSVTSYNKSSDYTVVVVRPIYPKSGDAHRTVEGETATGFQTVFPIAEDSLDPTKTYNINSSATVREALSKDFGSATRVKSYSGTQLAIGYTQIQIDDTMMWSVIIEQKRSTFLAPVKRLTNIVIGVVIGIGVFMCLITFPLAVWFVHPITKLREATEYITKLKKQKSAGVNIYTKSNSSNSSGHFLDNSIPPSPSPTRPPSPPPPSYASLFSRFLHRNQNHKPCQEKDVPQEEPEVTDKTKRKSVTSLNTGASNSVYSSAIRLPNKIVSSKKFFKDELTELSDAFNIMTEELDKQYTHLEDRVKLRTKELEASKLEAEAANEAKTVFIANISHELRTPLNGILGMTAIAMEESDHSRIKDSLKLIHRSGDLLLHILTELLTYSKNTLNRSKLEKSHFQILEVVYQVQSIFGKLAIDQKVNFKILLKPNIFRKMLLYGDSNRIIQIVMNLVSNSLKFTPVDGSVDVTFKLLGEYDYIRSRDDNFTKVHILRHMKADGKKEFKNHGKVSERDRLSSLQQSSTTTTKTDNDTDINSMKSSPASVKSSFPSVHEHFNDAGGDGDNMSIVTLSTTEYENTIFYSQFKGTRKSSTLSGDKPLPHQAESIKSSSPSEDFTEKDGPRDSSSNDQLANGKKTNEESKLHNYTLTEKASDEKDKKSTDIQEPKDILRNKTDAEGSPIPHNLSTVEEISREDLATTTAPHNKPKRSLSGASFFSTNELVKNDNVYQMRTLYEPKTWVLQIEVSDTGLGIEPALQEKVFEPFVQGDQTLSRSYGGTGLGLSICRQLAKMMNGTLTLKSTIGKGSTFTFNVPLPQTGEIMVPDEEMDEFCEDEFNPASKVNRKVAFDVISSPDQSQDAVTQEELSEKSFDGKLANELSDSKSDGTNKSGLLATDYFNDEHPNTSRSSSSSSKKFKHKLDIPSRSTFSEKPHLMTRSSTGTANSHNGSTDHSLLDNLSHLRILVAEDNSVNQEVIKRMLKLEGFQNITMACNGAEAVEFVKESYDKLEMYDIIFMDVQMPKIDGLTATKMIRNSLHYTKPIIALTAFADESNVKECLNSGMSGFLAKPIKRTNLRKIINEFSPSLLDQIITTPQTIQSEERRLGYGFDIDEE